MKTFSEYADDPANFTTEALTNAQRQKRKAAFRKNKSKIAIGRKKAAKKLASPDKLKSRAAKTARGEVEKKILKNKKKSDLSFSARQSLEKKVKAKSGLVKRLSKKLLPQVRKKDRAKLKK